VEVRVFSALLSSVFSLVILLFWVAVFAGFVYVCLRFIRRKWRPSKKEQTVLDWAAADGWTVELEPDQVSWADLLPGRKTGAVRMLLRRDVAGHEVSVADYRWSRRRQPGLLDVDRVGNEWENHHYVAARVGLPGQYPPVEVGRPDRLGWLDDVLEVDIGGLADRYTGPRQVPSDDPEFDAHIAVRAYDPAAASVIGPQLRQAMLAGQVPRSWQLKGSDLVVWRSGSFTEPQQVVDLTNGVLGVAQLLGR
jgi:hypothetical protein